MREKLYLATEKWNLTEVETIYENRNRAVYSAISAEYGPVILKLNHDTLQLREEYTMLHKLNGSGCCKVFAYDEKSGMLLEERLLPGTVLREEESLVKRMEVLKTVFHKIHQMVGNDTKNPSYLDWLEGAYQFCIDNDVDTKLTEKAKLARDICAEIFEKYSERTLLHGDLHHDNILLRADGTYSMIDPKGVIGPEILDLPRFIMNELDTKHAVPDEEHMYEVVRMVSENFGYPIADVKKVYFMEVILGNIWCIEDGEEISEEEIEIATKMILFGRIP